MAGRSSVAQVRVLLRNVLAVGRPGEHLPRGLPGYRSKVQTGTAAGRRMTEGRSARSTGPFTAWRRSGVLLRGLPAQRRCPRGRDGLVTAP